MEGLDRIDGIIRRQWKAMERGGMFVGEKVGLMVEGLEVW